MNIVPVRSNKKDLKNMLINYPPYKSASSIWKAIWQDNAHINM